MHQQERIKIEGNRDWDLGFRSTKNSEFISFAICLEKESDCIGEEDRKMKGNFVKKGDKLVIVYKGVVLTKSNCMLT